MTSKTEKFESPVSILSLKSPRNRAQFIQVALNQVVAFRFLTFGLGGNIAKPEVIEQINRAKKRDAQQTIGIAVPELDTVKMIVDHSRLDPKISQLINSKDSSFQNRVSGLSLLGIPIQESAEINSVSLNSFIKRDRDNLPWLLLLHFGKTHRYAQALIKLFYSNPDAIFGVTSMNEHGEKNVTSTDEALKFLQKTNINTFIDDPIGKVLSRDNASGSYNIVVLGKSGIPTSFMEPDQVMEMPIHIIYRDNPPANMSLEITQSLWPEWFPKVAHPATKKPGGHQTLFYHRINQD